jgi:shikimate kinase
VKPDTNIVLVGMPAAGKSTLGIRLAKRLGYDYLDTDVHIQRREGQTLQAIIDGKGLAAFCRIEEQVLLGLDCRAHVIAPGGSAVYSRRAMGHLKKNGIVVHLDLDPARLARRLDNLASRGIVMAAGQTIADLYRERRPLYLKYADITVDCGDRTPRELVKEMLERLAKV